MRRALAVLTASTLVIASASVLTPAASAAAGPGITVTKAGPATVLAGATATYTVTAANPSNSAAVPEYNASFRDVLPAGVSYLAGSTLPVDVGEPTVLTDEPAVGQTTLIWSDAFDLQVGASKAFTFGVQPSASGFPVGSTLANTVGAYASRAPRIVPRFDSTGAAVPGATIQSAGSNTTITTITALSIGKTEPSPESKLLRGLHSHPTVYTVPVTNNGTAATANVVVTDYLPANQEFLGCGGIDNSAAVEYPGAPSLTRTPVIPAAHPADAAPSGCLTPASVATVLNPAGYPAGIYTQVIWNLGTLGSQETFTLKYATGIPLRANALFGAGGPSPASDGQQANLDNNTGPSTRQNGTAAATTNFVAATGTYTGPVAPGASTTVTATATKTDTVNDLRVIKSVSPVQFAAGGVVTYRLRIRASEYTDSAGVTVTDVLPNGVCPLDDVANYTAGAPADCAPAASDCPAASCAPTVPFAHVVPNADGTFRITFTALPSVAHDGSFLITYYGRMRTTYTGGTLRGSPTAAGDSFVNHAAETATTTPIPGTPESGPLPVTDPTSATQTTPVESLSKQIAVRANGMDCSAASYGGSPSPLPNNLTFALGDRVCFQVTVPFASSTETRNAVLTDFLPDNVSYEANSMTAGPGNTLPTAQFGFDEPTAESDGTLTWTLGAADPNGGRDIAAGAVLQVRFSALVTGVAAGPAPDKAGNIAKLRTTNSGGAARSLRDGVNFAVAPAPIGIVKGVASVNGTTNPGLSDHVAVREGDNVTFAVTVSNTSDPATAPPGVDITSEDVWDVLPAGVTCAAVASISDGGACTDPGAATQPSFAQNATLSAIRWVSAIDLAPGAQHRFTYVVHIPSGTSVAADLVDVASVRSYTTSSDTGTPATHFPGANVDTTVPVAVQDPQPASDPSDVFLASVGLSKGVVSSVNEAGNVGAEPKPAASTKATIGENVTYTVTARIPAGTSVYLGALTDPLPAGLTAAGPATARFAGSAIAPVFTALPAGFTLDATTGTVTFPAPLYDNTSTTDQLIQVIIPAVVANVPGNAAGRTTTNTATFTSAAGPSGGPAPAATTASAAVGIVEPRPTLTKTNDHPAATTTVVGGSIVTFTLTAGDASGRSVLHDSWVVDCLPAQLIFQSFVTAGANAVEQTATGPGGDGVSCPVGTQEIAWTSGDIAPGATRTLQYTAAVTGAPSGSAVYTNNAAITGDSLAGARSAPTAPGATGGRSYSATASSAVKVAAAAVTKTATPSTPTPGQRITYTVTAQLPSGVNFDNLTLLDTLPVGIATASATLVSVACANADGSTCLPAAAVQLTPAGTTLGWFLGDTAAAPQIRTVTVVYTALVDPAGPAIAGSALTNSVHPAWDITATPPPTSAGASFDETGSIATATVTVIEPRLSIAKTVSTPTPQPGGTFHYTVAVSNAATATTSPAYNVTVTDAVPTGVVVDPTTISDGGTISGADPVTGGGTISWTVAGPVAPGATISGPDGFSYDARLAPSATLDTSALTNTATVTGYDSLPTGGRHYTGPNATATVTPLFPALTAAVTTPGGTTAYIDEPFTWRDQVNDAVGAGTAYHAGAVDTLPPNWTYDPGSAIVSVNGGPPTQVDPTVTTVNGVATLTWPDLGTLPPGASLTITFTATPTPAVVTTPGVGLTVDHTDTVAPTGQDASGATGNLTGSYSGPPASAVAHIASADVSIVKTASSAPVAGGSGAWTLTVSNAGPDPAIGPFTVADGFDNPPPAGVSNVQAGGTGWSCTAAPIQCRRTAATDILAPGASFEPIVITYTVDSGVPATTPLSNTATVTARTFDPQPGNNTSTATTTVQTAADLGIVKTLTSALVAGTDATYSLAVTNYGPSTDRGPITVTDTLPAGTTFVSATGNGWTCPAPVAGLLTCSTPADLPAGSGEPQLVVTIHLADTQTDPVTNTATVTGSTPEPVNDPHPNTSTVTATPDTSADLEIAKVLTGSVVAGSQASYQISVTNHGPSAARNVQISDTLPALLTYVSTTGSDWICTAVGQDVLCTYAPGVLPSGATSVVTLTVTAGQQVAGDVVNTATVSSSTPDPVPGNNTSTSNSGVTDRADLSITKTHTGTAVAGQPLDYHLGVHNGGPSDEIGAITVQDVLPAGLTFTTATGTGWSCSYDDPSRTVTCVGATDLAAGADAHPITVTVGVDPDAGPGTLVNTAEVTGSPDSPDPNPANNSATDLTEVTTAADVTLTKVLVGDTPVVAGTDVTFDLTASNAGPSDAQSVVVSDTLPDHMTAVSATGDGWTCVLGPTVVCRRDVVAAVPPGAATPGITVVALIDASTPIDPPDGQTILTNTATVTTVTPGPVHDPAPVDVPVVARADLSITKTGSASATAGGTAQWAITVSNLGPSDASGPITVTDTLPGFETFVAADGAGWTCTATDPPSPAAADAHQIVTCTTPDGLASGGTAPGIGLTVAIDPAAPTGDETNQATVSAPTPDPVPANNTTTATVPVTRDTRLTIVKSHVGNAQVTGQLAFTLAVANVGASAADQVVVDDPLPAGLTFVSGSGSGWTCVVDGAGVIVTCTLAGTLAPSASAPPLTLITTVAPAAYPSVINTATVSSTDPDLPCSVTGVAPVDGTGCSTATDTVTVEPLATLGVVKRSVGGFVVGTNGTYQITVTNGGPTATPGPVTVIDDLPTSLGYVSGTGTNWTCVPTGQIITCTYAAGLAVGESQTLTLVVAVGASAFPQVQNTATATAPGSVPTSGSETTPVLPSVLLAAVKRLVSVVGTTATWSITVTNSGLNSTAGTTTVVDTLPDGLRFLAASGVGWKCSDAAAVVSCAHPGPIAAGGSAAITLTTTITAPAGTTIVNIATISNTQNPDQQQPSNPVPLTVGQPQSQPQPGGTPLSQTGVPTLSLIELATMLLVVGAVFLVVARRSRRS